MAALGLRIRTIERRKVAGQRQTANGRDRPKPVGAEIKRRHSTDLVVCRRAKPAEAGQAHAEVMPHLVEAKPSTDIATFPDAEKPVAVIATVAGWW
jgi:hypothetical protein